MQQGSGCKFIMNQQKIIWHDFEQSWDYSHTPHKGQRWGSLMFPVICAWTNGWVTNRYACDLRYHHVHYDVTIMGKCTDKSSITGDHVYDYNPFGIIMIDTDATTMSIFKIYINHEKPMVRYDLYLREVNFEKHSHGCIHRIPLWKKTNVRKLKFQKRVPY